MIPNQIIVHCLRDGFTHARLIGSVDKIVIEFGRFHENTFVPRTHEVIALPDHPELGEVWDGCAWNARELSALVDQCCPENDQ